MDVVGSEIGQKMRSAIKAKLTELGCYVDDELPDYVMVMVANKRTRAQMEDDLQLFLGDNTELFVNWLHQVLKKLQEVTITAPAKPVEQEKIKERSKSKEKKAKKPDSAKKAKKKEKEKVKSLRKKEKAEKKLHKGKKKKSKSSKHEMIRPNIPPLLMNMEKESEPSITDVFAGQILKNHGVIIEPPKVDVVDKKQDVQGAKRPILPIIDPSTILSKPEISEPSPTIANPVALSTTTPNVPGRDEQIKEINEIEAKIQGLKQKLAEQLDSMSEDEDFLNIRTEAEELMNDFAEDVLQEISQPTPITPPPIQTQKSPEPSTSVTPLDPPKMVPIQEELPQIELRLPKRPVRERLGAKQDQKRQEVKEKETEKRKRDKSSSPERFTPERELKKSKSAKSRLGEPAETQRKYTQDEDRKEDKKLTSRVSVLSTGSKSRCASVVRVRPRPRVTPSSSLLLKAMADAHKSLFNAKPPKPDPPQPQIQRATVLPMRRCADASNIVIEVRRDSDVIVRDDQDDDKLSKSTNEDLEKEEYIPTPITKVFANTDYVPSTREERHSRRDDEHSIIVETINIHNPSTNRDKDTKFIVTMDGFNPNAFLAKKLQTEGLLEEDDQVLKKPKTKTESVLRIKDNAENESESKTDDTDSPEPVKLSTDTTPIKNKRLSDTSEESDTQVIINSEDIKITRNLENRKRTVHTKEKKDDNIEKQSVDNFNKDVEEPSVKKRKASPIVFSAKKEEKEMDTVGARERTESVSSDKSVTVTTSLNSNKYDSLPPLDKAAAAIVAPATKPWCRLFPSCKWGSSCAFAHPKCKFGAACSRRGCVYSHPAKIVPTVASHVIPAANFKSISATALPTVCKFFPNCVNPVCTYHHPKPCRYGKACMNKIECNFYHNDVLNSAFRYV